MFGLSRKKSSPPQEPLAPPSADEIAGTLHYSFRALEIATLALDGIAYRLGEARTLARCAARPEGASQRGLIAARYAALKDEIERRSAEQTLANGVSIAVALGTDEDDCAGNLLSQELPDCEFRNADEARALAGVMDSLLRAVEEQATRIREAAGHIADEIAKGIPMAAPEPAQPQSRAAAAPAATQRRRRAA